MSSKEDKLLNKKWSKLNEIIPLFRFIPFVDFVLVSGSMAIGNVKRNSDFDVLIGVKEGRIFTVRIFCYVLFSILGLARRQKDTKIQANNKLCFNHFVTSKSYKLSNKPNKYWKDLYRNLVPVYGNKVKITNFFNENSWSGREVKITQINTPYPKSIITKVFELVLGGFLGNFFEFIFKKYQIVKINKSIKNKKKGYKPLVFVNDKEIRFHEDTKRVEEYVKDRF